MRAKFWNLKFASSNVLLSLSSGGSLLFQQVPLVEIDGMKMVQTRAILNYIAAKYNLYGKDLKERALYCDCSSWMCYSSLDTCRINRVVAHTITDVLQCLTTCSETDKLQFSATQLICSD